MKAPTPGELRTAIEVLKKLGERLNNQAAHSVLQLPESRLGRDYAASIEVSNIERIAHIENVTAQLQSWHDELREQRRQSVTHHV